MGPAKDSIRHSLSGPMAKDLPYTPFTDATLRRLADLQPRTLAVMHGSSYQGDGRAALLELAAVLGENFAK